MKIGLFDHMGYGNLGDAATQDAIIGNIRKRLPHADFVGFSLNPEDTSKRHSITSYSITYWHPGLGQAGQPDTTRKTTLWSRITSLCKTIPVLSRLARHSLHLLREIRHLVRSFAVLKSLDTLIVAGGGQLCDLWRGPWSHPYNIFKFSVLTKLANRKLIFLNVGAGPLSSRLSRLFIKLSVRLADYVSLRDPESEALVRQLGIKRSMAVFPDSVYALHVPQGEDTCLVHTSKPLVGINPIGFSDPRVWAKKDRAAYERYLDDLTTFCLWLLRQGYPLRVFSGEVSVDLYAWEDLKKRLLEAVPGADVAGMFRAPSMEVTGLLAEMAQLDIVITSKFHGVVFCHLLNKPVVALSYHRKIEDLMRSVGHIEHCLNIETFDLESLKTTFLLTEERADELKALFRQRTRSRTEALGVQFDDLFVAQNLEFGSGFSKKEGVALSRSS